MIGAGYDFKVIKDIKDFKVVKDFKDIKGSKVLKSRHPSA